MSLDASLEPQSSPGLLLWHLSMAWQSKQRSALALHDLTHVQFVLLALLVHAENAPLSQAELARRASLDPMMTSQVARALEAKGLVNRASSSSDGRALQVSATGEGAQVANRAVKDVEQVDREFFAPLGGDVGQFSGLAKLLIDALAQGRG